MKPVIILVRPEIPENIGFVARSMTCFGYRELRLVGALLAREGKAWKTASGGEGILETTVCFDSLPEALADCHLVWGFSRRPNRLGKELPWNDALASFSAAYDAGGSEAKLALVFGPESQGLQSMDGESIGYWVAIPTAHATMSLNLSHAVTTVLFALSQVHSRASGVIGEQSEAKEGIPMANREFLALGWDLLSRELKRAEIYPAAKAEAQFDYLQSLWNRLRLDQNEAEFLLGSLKKLFRASHSSPMD